MNRFLAVCLNPTFQRTVSLKALDKGEVNRADEARLDASGKGVNVARVLEQLGSKTLHLTHLGPGKEAFIRLCEADGLELAWVDSASPIRTCITLLDSGEASTTEIIEPTGPVDEQTVMKLRIAFSRELQKSKWIILSGSKAPGYPANLYADFCAEAKEAGVPVLADYRGAELAASLPHHPAVVKTNLVEFCETFLKELSVSEGDDTAALPAVREKLKELSTGGIDFVLTRGARDIYCASKGRISTVAPPKIVPVNTIGSGDSVAAGMAHSLAGGAELEEAVREGARCGSLNALLLKPGAIR